MFTEESFENVVIEYLKELNYDYIHGSNLTRDNKEVLLLENLKTNLININKEIPESSIDYAIKKIQNFETNDVFTNNKLFHKYLTEGIEITDFINGKTAYHTIKLIDFDNIKNNEFLVVNQLEIVEDDINKIPDIIVYVNGIPLVCMELKSTSREEVSIEDEVIDTLGVDYKNLDTLLYGMFDKERFLDIIKNFILFIPKGKILAQYHQYYGMKKAINSVINAVDNDGRAGVVWHTQGSGKSFSMTFLA